MPESEVGINLVSDMVTAPDKVRRVGQNESAEFYAALIENPGADPDEEHPRQGLCFIIVDDELDVGAATCAGTADLDEPIIAIQTSSSDGSVEAFLIPDDTTLETPEGWHRASANVVVISDPSVAERELVASLPDNQEITLQRGP